jgi:Uma2 family endonuclease
MNASDDRSDELGATPVGESHVPNDGAPGLISNVVGPLLALAPEDYPDVSGLVTEDDTPVDNPYVERQCRLLVDLLYGSWVPPQRKTFVAMANVGLFFALYEPPLVPDFLFSLDVKFPPDILKKEHRSYFVWLYGKVPDVVIEIVSDRRGGEDTFKMRQYARLGVLYYVIYDPTDFQGSGVLRVLELHRRDYRPVEGNWLSAIGLGLTFWEGIYQGIEGIWLRWCDQQGRVLLTSQERAEQEHQRAEQEHQRAEEEHQRAEQESKLADQERQRADELTERLKQLEALLQAKGLEPSS